MAKSFRGKYYQRNIASDITLEMNIIATSHVPLIVRSKMESSAINVDQKTFFFHVWFATVARAMHSKTLNLNAT
jgi:hypothetical protein